MRVLHAIGSISPARGGPSVAIRNTVEALGLHGIHADIVTTDDDGPDRRSHVPPGSGTQLNGSRVFCFPRQSTFYAASWPLLQWLRTHVRDYDVVHTHGLFSFVPIVAARVARAQGVPYVMRPAGMLDIWSRVHRRPMLKNASIRLLEGPLLSAAARVHFTSQVELTQASELRLPISGVVLPLGLDLQAVQTHPSATPDTDLQRITGAPNVLYLSRIDYKKNLDTLIRAFAIVLRSHAGAILLIAGDGPPSLVDQLKNLAAELGLAGSIRWLGFVQGVSKQWLLSHSDIFVLPSASENFGVAAAEAMAAGLPVVLTRGVAMAELAESAGCGMITDGSPEAVATAIDSLLANPDLRKRMGSAGRQAARDELSLDCFGHRLQALYQSVLRQCSHELAAS